MSSDSGCPIQVEVNAGRLVEGKGSAINLRFTNLSSDEAFSFEVEAGGDLLPSGLVLHERLGPFQQVSHDDVKVFVPAATTKCVVRLRVVVEDASHGRHTFRGSFSEDVHSAGDGPSVVNYNVTARDGSVVDASGVHIGHLPAGRAQPPAWRSVPMRANATADTLSRCVLLDVLRHERLAIDGRHSIVIGRDGGDADVQVVDPSRKISRSHCRIYLDAGAAWIEHLSRTNTTRLDGAEVAGRIRVSEHEVGMIVLAGAVRLRLSPIATAVVVGARAATNSGVEAGVKTSPAVGGYLIEAVDPPNAIVRTLWLLGAVRASDVLPRVKESTLVLASEPHLVRGEWSSDGSLVGTRPLLVQEQVAGWVVVG